MVTTVAYLSHPFPNEKPWLIRAQPASLGPDDIADQPEGFIEAIDFGEPGQDPTYHACGLELRKRFGGETRIIVERSHGVLFQEELLPCLFGLSPAASLENGAIAAMVDLYAVRVVIRIEEDGTTTALSFDHDWGILDSKGEVIFLSRLNVRRVAAQTDTKLEPASHYRAMAPEDAAAAIAADFESRINANLIDFLTAGEDDPRLGARALSFEQGSLGLLTERLADIATAFHESDAWPVRVVASPVLEVADAAEAMENATVLSLATGKLGDGWRDEDKAAAFLMLALRENAGFGTELVCEPRWNGVLASDWSKSRSIVAADVEAPSAHERLAALERLEAAFGGQENAA